jgi:ABC-type transport system involved in multi-copper enzyme maturation permease subunit
MLGPVFRFELITTARRKRYYVARVVYGLFLLVSLGSQYGEGEWSRYVTISIAQNSIEEMSLFARQMFAALAWAQGVALVCLAPALLAGVIADEAQRKTLHYLLASRMSSTEIVLGKLGARLLHVGVIVLMGVPVVCLVALLGGLDPWEVTYIYAGTFSLVLFVSGLSLLVSVLAPRPREAILVTYVLVFVWLFLPPILVPIAPAMDWPLNWVRPVNDFLLLMNPIYVWELLTNQMSMYATFVASGGPAAWLLWMGSLQNAMLIQFLWMAGLQSAFGVVFLVLAILGLRPLRGREGRPSVKQERGHFLATVARTLRTDLKRPPCDEDDPMLWKETYAAGGGFTWLRSRPVVLFLGVLLGCYLYDTALPALGDLVGQRWGTGGGSNPRLVLNAALRQSSTLLFVLLLLSVASAAAVSLTSEREQDTWTSLAGTLLTGREIIRAKIKGALWCSKRLVLAILIMWTIGLLAGAVFPLGAAAAVAGLFVFGGFTAALGVWISLGAKNSTRALFATIFWLLVFNAGYLVLVPGTGRESDLALAGMMPYLEWASLISYPDALGLASGSGFTVEGSPRPHGVDTLVAYLLALFGYGMGTLILTGAAIERLDKAIDRARSDAAITGPRAMGSEPSRASGRTSRPR